MKRIQTLIPDVQGLLSTKGWFTDELANTFGREVARRLQVQFNRDESAPSLRLSQMGPRCPKALWHSIHTPWLAEPLPPWAENKYAFGHIIEAWAITLAKAAGHSVEGEQDELILDGIKGHRDCVIDGCVVDVKSVSSRQYPKYKNKTLAQDDMFGYLDQVDGYLVASAFDPIVQIKDKGYLWAIDKTLGHSVLYEHTVRDRSIKDRVKTYKEFVNRDQPPECTCGTRASGQSGNIELDVRAGYSPYKHVCFPGLRTFLYAKGPVYLTHVAREPKDVIEIRRPDLRSMQSTDRHPFPLQVERGPSITHAF